MRVRGIGIPALMSLPKENDMKIHETHEGKPCGCGASTVADYAAPCVGGFHDGAPRIANFRDWAAATGERPIAWEAVCTRCGESFNPSGDELTLTDDDGTVRVEHYGTELAECGGFGPIVGSWR